MEKIIFSVIVILSLTACAAAFQVKPEDIQKAHFSSKPTQGDAETKIRAYLDGTLIDPESLRLNCESPQKGWARDDLC